MDICNSTSSNYVCLNCKTSQKMTKAVDLFASITQPTHNLLFTDREEVEQQGTNHQREKDKLVQEVSSTSCHRITYQPQIRPPAPTAATSGLTTGWLTEPDWFLDPGNRKLLKTEQRLRPLRGCDRGRPKSHRERTPQFQSYQTTSTTLLWTRTRPPSLATAQLTAASRGHATSRGHSNSSILRTKTTPILRMTRWILMEAAETLTTARGFIASIRHTPPSTYC